jgi:transposase
MCMIRGMTTLADDLVPDELWALVAPLLPAPPRPPYGGRHRTIPDRNCFAAIVYVARTSTPWRLLPARELGCGSPATCWRRLTEWTDAGVFDALHLEVVDRLGEQGQGGVLGTAWPASVEGRAVAVMVELLAATAGALDRDSGRWFAFVLVACAIVCFDRL